MLAALPPDNLTLDQLLEVAPDEWNPGMIQEAVLNLQSLDVLFWDLPSGRIRLRTPLPDAAPTRQSEARYDRVPVAPPPVTGLPQISLLSLFSGMGTDRLALERLLHQEGQRDRMGPSWSVESDPSLRTAVSQHWAGVQAADPTTASYTPLCEDVWQLLNPTHTRPSTR